MDWLTEEKIPIGKTAARFFDWLQEVSFPEQPLGRTILGPSERVSQFSRKDLSGFIAEHYGPEKMILAAAGGVDHDTIVAEAEALFGHLPRGRSERRFSCCASQRRSSFLVTVKATASFSSAPTSCPLEQRLPSRARRPTAQFRSRPPLKEALLRPRRRHRPRRLPRNSGA